MLSLLTPLTNQSPAQEQATSSMTKLSESQPADITLSHISKLVKLEPLLLPTISLTNSTHQESLLNAHSAILPKVSDLPLMKSREERLVLMKLNVLL
jgi:hypothetical protein